MEERIIDQIIARTKFPELQKQLLSKNETMSISEVLNTCRSYKASINYMRQMGELQEKGDNHIRVIKHRLEDTDNCGKCGLNHKNGNCPARSSTCSACGRMNHGARMCHNKKPQNLRQAVTDEQVYKTRIFAPVQYVHKNLQNSINIQDHGADEFEKMSFYSIEDRGKKCSFASLDIILPNRKGVYELKIKVGHRHGGKYIPLTHIPANVSRTYRPEWTTTSWHNTERSSSTYSIQRL